MPIQVNRTVSVNATHMTHAELLEFVDELDDAPLDTKINFQVSQGDRPWDSDQVTMSATFVPMQPARRPGD